VNSDPNSPLNPGTGKNVQYFHSDCRAYRKTITILIRLSPAAACRKIITMMDMAMAGNKSLESITGMEEVTNITGWALRICVGESIAALVNK
jgi:hypothetical protein